MTNLNKKLKLKEAGNEAFNKGRLEDAKKKYTKALSYDFKKNETQLKATILRNLSQVFYKQEKLQEAIDAANQAIQVDPQNPNGYIRKFFSQQYLGDMQEAIQSLKDGIQNCKKSDSNRDLQDLLAQFEKMGTDQNMDEESLLKKFIDRLQALNLEKPIKMTVLSGFLGAGKTTLLKRILEENNSNQDLKMAVIVNDMAEINIDASLVREANTEEEIVEMSNGCICCTLRSDLLEQVTQLLESRKFNYIVVESTGISEPMPVAATFQSIDKTGRSLNSFIEIDAMVTVLDGSQYLNQLKEGESLKDKQMEAGEGDERTISQLIMDQTEFADIILLNKLDLIQNNNNNQDADEIKEIIQRLNPSATVIQTQHCDVDLDKIINVSRFDMMKASESAGWFVELHNSHTPETEEYGISSVIFEEQRPFHPQRFDNLANNILPNVGVRSKGFFWVANRPTLCYELSIAGSSVTINPFGEWQGPEGKDNPEWHPKWGDRVNKLVIIGQKLEKDTIKNEIQQCLATEEEITELEMHWQNLVIQAKQAAQDNPDQNIDLNFNN